MICVANQWTGFYMITASVLKGLNICDELVSELKYVSTKEIYGLAFVGVKQQS